MSSARSKMSWVPTAATALAVLSCYGTTVLIGLLSLLGVTLALDPRIWAAAISSFAALAAVAIAASCRRRRTAGPTVVAALGLGLIFWTMYGSYSRAVEFAGFTLLIAATLWDWRARVSRRAGADGISWVEAQALADLLERNPKPVVVDVRGPDEFDGSLGHVANALNLPFGELPDRLTQINAFRAKPIVLVCRTDKRSGHAAALLRDSGFRDVHVLRGGMERWNEKGLPVERQTVLGPT